MEQQIFVGPEPDRGSFFGAQIKYTTGGLTGQASYDVRDKWLTTKGYTLSAFTFGVHYGFQRSLSDRWLLKSHIGAGYSFNLSLNGNHWFPAAGIKLRYQLRKS